MGNIDFKYDAIGLGRSGSVKALSPHRRSGPVRRRPHGVGGRVAARSWRRHDGGGAGSAPGDPAGEGGRVGRALDFASRGLGLFGSCTSSSSARPESDLEETGGGHSPRARQLSKPRWVNSFSRVHMNDLPLHSPPWS